MHGHFTRLLKWQQSHVALVHMWPHMHGVQFRGRAAVLTADFTLGLSLLIRISPTTLRSDESPDASIIPSALTTLGLAGTLLCNGSDEKRSS